MHIVLLPGMDGTGELFHQFVKALDGKLQPQVVRYPNDITHTLPALTDYVESLMPQTRPYILLGESFSGRIAYEVARRKRTNTLAVVFVATFLQNPRPIALGLRQMLPLQWLLRVPPPNWIIKHYFLGLKIEPTVANHFKHIVGGIPPTILKQRLNLIAALSLPLDSLEIPSLYLQASNDIFVWPRSAEDFEACCKKLRIQQIAGKHFLLQSSPVTSAHSVMQFLSDSVEYSVANM